MDAPIRHAKSGPGSGDRNLRIYEKQLKQGAQLDARQTYYYGRELLDNGRYDQAEKVLEEFLTRKDAWTIRLMHADSWLCAGTDKRKMKRRWRPFFKD